MQEKSINMKQGFEHNNSIKPNYLVLAHFVIFSLGLLKITEYFSHIFYNHIDIDQLLTGINEWAEYFSHDKLLALLQYGFSLIALLLFYKLCAWVTYRGKQSKFIDLFLRNTLIIRLYLIFALLFNVSVICSSNHVIALIFLWFIFFLPLPFFYLRERFIIIKKARLLYVPLVVFIILQFFFVFKPFIFNSMLIENDYIDIPEKTLLSDGTIVDNGQYINEHKIGGLLIYNPREDLGQTPGPRSDTSIKMDESPFLYAFLKKYTTKYRYTYYPNVSKLSLNSEMTPEERRELKEISIQTEHKNNISLLYYLSLDQSQLYKKRIYSPQEKEFIKKNILELGNKVKAGWQLYHHNYILGPINAISLGALPENQTLLYGWLNTISLMKIMKLIDDINYQTYFKLLFSFYPLYYILFLVTILFIFRKIEYTLISALLLSTSIFIIGDQLIRVAPGFNPIRHLFDTTTFLFFFIYLKKEKSIYLICSLMLGLLSVLWSKDFGLFLLLSIIGSVIVQSILEKNKLYLSLISGCSAIIGFLFYFLPFQGKNPAFKYMLLGLGMPDTSTNIIICSLIIISLGYLICLSLISFKNNIKFLSLALFFYCQLILVYFIWYPSLHHLLAIAPPFIFLAITWLYLYNKGVNTKADEREKIFSTTILSIFIFIYLPSMAYFYYGRMKYEALFKTHVIYHWISKKAMFHSTMEPDLFNEAVALINKYERHNHIYLISKYDTIIPILANKYSKLFFTDLPLNLISKQEINMVINKIDQEQPDYLFIDSDITRNFNGEIFNINDILAKKGRYQESLGRVSVLTNLRTVYFGIKKHYQPIESGYLITVYKKITA